MPPGRARMDVRECRPTGRFLTCGEVGEPRAGSPQSSRLPVPLLRGLPVRHCPPRPPLALSAGVALGCAFCRDSPSHTHVPVCPSAWEAGLMNFPFFLPGLFSPQSSGIWELSRFEVPFNTYFTGNFLLWSDLLSHLKRMRNTS